MDQLIMFLAELCDDRTSCNFVLFFTHTHSRILKEELELRGSADVATQPASTAVMRDAGNCSPVASARSRFPIAILHNLFQSQRMSN